MNYKHFNITERNIIYNLNKISYSTREIAKILNRHHSSIARELKRNTTNNKSYNPHNADSNYIKNKKKCGRKTKLTNKLRQEIEFKLYLSWSPEQISNTLKDVSYSTTSIYKSIYKGLIRCNFNCLRHKGKRRKKYYKRGKFAIGRSIHERPMEIENRETFGHWELDTVVSGKGKSKVAFATFLERKTRYYEAIIIPDKTAESYYIAIETLINKYGLKAFKSFTVDRGREFSCYKKVEKNFKIPVYFCDAYSSWQRGANENANGLLREFIPKSTNLSTIPKEYLSHILSLIHNRPRKCLYYNTSVQLFFKEVSHLI